MVDETIEENEMQQWESLNPISSMQEILGLMQTLEQNFFIAKKMEEGLNNRQGDLLHALELDLDRKEINAVYRAKREIRFKRRDIKDILINLVEAQNFIKANYKFINECNEAIKKMQRTSQKVSNRKYSYAIVKH
ncbi:hypothetical protein B1B04_09435 [Lysinibacillus sp. KCTC 33748]|uniref:hypothetical protein n=1 Tax=unclassified Lysinibacillus TaxID=2636778 RepID=UPI0009A90FA1|nr:MULTISPECIES: hypothetical protein [unclassified Lysinibacillus]OXS74336.1 hypothetical protein B1B04_09435 [Lysinibacillus sp. KCTC 33748]SKB64505.1 hypothetical protein SAMN06295926_10569 [Lysinibacillus sp. AC-3]